MNMHSIEDDLKNALEQNVPDGYLLEPTADISKRVRARRILTMAIPALSLVVIGTLGVGAVSSLFGSDSAHRGTSRVEPASSETTDEDATSKGDCELPDWTNDPEVMKKFPGGIESGRCRGSNDDMKSRPYRLYVHCGLMPIKFLGRWWAPTDPALRMTGNPPQGFDEDGDNLDNGTIRLISEDSALYTAEEGKEVEYEPIELPENPPACW